jgi:hypothetical protein
MDQPPGEPMDEQTMLAFVADVPELAAGSFLDGLVTQDFARLREALAPHVHLRALLPGGLKEWTGAAAVADRFARWFGDTVQFEPVESSVGEVGHRNHLRWRFRLQADRLGPGSFVVEQLAYADVDQRGQIARLDLLCTGYLPERSDG